VVEEKFIIKAQNGLGSRPSASLVFEANKFNCTLKLKYADDIANMKSIMSIMALVIRKGEEFEVICEGEDEVDALKHIKEYMEKIELV